MSEKDLNKIKRSFEESNEMAPEESWSLLSERLNFKSLDDKVKSSFEVSAASVAPDFDFDMITEQPVDSVVKNSYEQTIVAAPDGSWQKILNGLEVSKSWEKIADKIVVKSTAWKTLVAAACLTLLVSLIPNYVTDTSIITLDSDSYEWTNQEVFEIQKYTSDLTDISEPRFDKALYTDLSVLSDLRQNQGENDLSLVPLNSNSNSLEVMRGLEPSAMTKIIQTPVLKMAPTAEVQKPQLEKKSKWSVGIFGGINRTWIHDDLSREAYDKNTTISSKFVVGDMKGLAVAYDVNDKLSVQANLFSATSRNKLGLFAHGNYIFRTNQIKFLKANFLVSTTLLPYKSKVNLLFKAGPSFAYVLSNSTKVEDKIVTFNEGYKKLNIAANTQVGLSYKFSNFIFETGANVELGLRNLFDSNNSLEQSSNFTNNMDLGIYTSLRYQF